MNFDTFTSEQIQDARSFVADGYFKLAEECFGLGFGFADHVTYEEKLKYARENITLAGEILSGFHDHNFTVKQKMWFFLTGDDTPFLR